MKHTGIRELKNYFFLKKVIRAEKKKKDSKWNTFKNLYGYQEIRTNWYGRIYTTVSLREEDMGEEELVRNWKAMEMMRPINEYLSSLGLQELIFPSIEAIPESRSYLIVYSPIFEKISFSWFFWRILLATGVFTSLYLI